MSSGRFHQRFAAILCAALVSMSAGIAWSNERVIYVDAAATGGNDGSSWADAYHDLQDALAEASGSAPAVIRVAQGTYRPGPPMGATLQSWQATFQLHNHVTLEGGYAGALAVDPDARDVEGHPTILSGDLAGDDSPGDDRSSPARRENCRHVVTASGTDATAVIDGFTITRAAWHGMQMELASPTIRRCRFVENTQAGIYAWDCSSVLTECTFERNGPSWSAFISVRGNPTLTDCVFVENQGGGIQGSGSLDLLRCSFVGNTDTTGAGIRFAGDLTARNCRFTSNAGTAVNCSGRATLIDCEFIGNSSSWHAGAVKVLGSLILEGCEFVGNSGGGMNGGAVTIGGDLLQARNCVFAGNSGGSGPGAIFTHSTAVVRLSNCTFVGNRGRPNAVEHPPMPQAIAVMANCIVWDGPDPFTKFEAFEPGIVVTYSNVQGGYPGEGNIDIDPLFVDPGYWDTNGTPDDPDDDIYVAGDYHLKSQAGRWDRAAERWAFDDVTSPCIDAGDPLSPIRGEPFPNGGFVNMGAYGGTPEASRSYFGQPVCETRIAGDINGDCRVDDLDLEILMLHWLRPDIGKPNVPPTIRLISPAEGDEFAPGTPMVFRAEASDPDGAVVRVTYNLTGRGEYGTQSTGPGLGDPDDDWTVAWEWWRTVKIYPDRTYTVRAKAIDSDGAVTETPEIEIKVMP